MPSTCSTRVHRVPLAELERAWPLVEAMIADACARDGLYGAGDVLEWLRGDKMQLWLAGSTERGVEAAAISEMLQHRAAKTFSVFIVTGADIDRWLPHLGRMEAWAKEMGCSRAIQHARRGYARKLKDYRMTHVVLEKQL